jgi:large subunit ribosomal protein L9e
MATLSKLTFGFASRKPGALVKTVCSHVENMFTGVIAGFENKMRVVYAHFRVNTHIPGDGSFIEIPNFLGERQVRRINMLSGTV